MGNPRVASVGTASAGRAGTRTVGAGAVGGGVVIGGGGTVRGGGWRPGNGCGTWAESVTHRPAATPIIARPTRFISPIISSTMDELFETNVSASASKGL